MTDPRRLAVLLLLVLLALAGCDDDPTAPDGDVTRLPSSRDEVVQHLMTSLTQRNIDAYELVLHDDFVFTFSAGSLYGTTWDRATELDAVDRLLEGLSGLDPITNFPLSGVIGVEVYDNLIQQAWQEAGDDWEAIHQIGLRFTLGDGTRYTVEGEQNFRVRQVTVQEDGETVQRWQLVGQEDLIPDLKATDWSWGAFKRCYLR